MIQLSADSVSFSSRQIRRSLGFGLYVWVLGACAGQTPSVETKESKLEEGTREVSAGLLDLTCAETNADRCSDCFADARRRADECYRTTTDIVLAGGSSPVSSCARIGDSSHCSGICELDRDECVTYEHKFVPTGASDLEILEACQAATERGNRCEEVRVGPACETYAMVERPETVEAYRCAANTACGESLDGCFESFSESDVADRLSELCDEKLDERTREMLNRQGSWNTEEVVESLLDCARSYCGTGEVRRCALAWLSGVTGVEPSKL